MSQVRHGFRSALKVGGLGLVSSSFYSYTGMGTSKYFTVFLGKPSFGYKKKPTVLQLGFIEEKYCIKWSEYLSTQ